MGTFDVGGNLNEPRPSSGGMLESSAAVIKDLSSLTALSHVDPEQALLDLLSHCGIDVEIIDQKWHHEILPLFESISPNVSSSSILYPDEDPDSFKEFLHRSHLGDPRHLSATMLFNGFKDNYCTRVSRLSKLISKIRDDPVLPGFLFEWVEGDEGLKTAVVKRVKRMFALYKSQDYKSKTQYLGQFDSHFLEHLETEGVSVKKQRDNVTDSIHRAEALVEEATRALAHQDKGIAERKSERQKTETLRDLLAQLEKVTAEKKEEEEAEKKRKDDLAALKRQTKEAESRRKDRDERDKERKDTAARVGTLRTKIAHYQSKSNHPWVLENFRRVPGGFFYFRFPRYKFIFDVSLGAATPTDRDGFEVASAALVPQGIGIKSDASDNRKFTFKDLKQNLPLLLYNMDFGEESPRMWTMGELKARLTDLVTLMDGCHKLFCVYEQLCDMKRRRQRKLFQLAEFCVDNNNDIFMAVYIRAGAGGKWPIAVMLKFLLTPNCENHAKSFHEGPFHDRLIVLNWLPWAREKVDIHQFKTALFAQTCLPCKPMTAPDLNQSSLPPFNRFILDCVENSRTLLEEKYAQYLGDQAEVSIEMACD